MKDKLAGYNIPEGAWPWLWRDVYRGTEYESMNPYEATIECVSCGHKQYMGYRTNNHCDNCNNTVFITVINGGLDC